MKLPDWLTREKSTSEAARIPKRPVKQSTRWDSDPKNRKKRKAKRKAARLARRITRRAMA